MSRDRFTEKDENGKWAVRLSEDCQMSIEHSEKVNNDGSKTCTPVFVYAPFVDKLAEYENLIFSPGTLMSIIKEWKEWADAKNDGRLVILPCKEGDPVYRVYGKCVGGMECEYQGGRGAYRCTLGSGLKCGPFIESVPFRVSMLPEIGKSIFVKKAKAEACLQRNKGIATDGSGRSIHEPR